MTIMNAERKELAPGGDDIAGPFDAEMIHPLTDKGLLSRAPFVRKRFALDGQPRDAVLRISALGLYRCFINGQRVGDDLLTPGWTSYYDRLSYQTYPVGDLLQPGENVIDIWLADGWLRSQMLSAPFGIYKTPIFNTWGDKLGAIAELSVDDQVIVKTDESWRSGLSPVLKSGIYFGEIYDAREEGREADQGCEVLADFDKSTLIPHEVNAVRELEPAFAVQSQFQDAEGRTIYDFGQNAAGYTEIAVKGAVGARIIVEHAEVLDKDGVFSRDNLRLADARLEYVLKGDGVERYKPMFTFHGFRYARVALEGTVELVDIKFIPISSATTPAGDFTCGNELVNRLVLNTIWSQRSNFIEVPTDCPQRDERLGWTGDAQVFAATACYLHESEQFLHKYVRDMMADQRPDGSIPHVVPDISRGHEDQMPNFSGSTGWGDAICVIPWVLYEHYGDTSVLEEALPAMVRWNAFVWNISGGPIVVPPRGTWAELGFTFGDWLQPKGSSVKPLPTIGDDAAATFYLYISSMLTAKAARVVGNDEIATRMDKRAEEVKAAFQHEFITPGGRVGYDDQTSYALAIVYDLIPEAQMADACRHFIGAIERTHGRIGTGFIGTPVLLPALTKIGAYEMAEHVFLQEDVPGWMYQIRNGATTIWERWDAIQADGTLFDPEMNSYNHYAYGAVCQWLFESVAGIRPDEAAPGFEHIIFEPVILPKLSPVTAHHDTRAGRIEASWSISGDDAVTYEVTVPDGATGTLVLSHRYADPGLDGAPITTKDEDGNARCPLAPGKHTITFRISGLPDYPVTITPGVRTPLD